MCVFEVFAFFSRVLNLLLTKLARDLTGRILGLGLFCKDLPALGLYCQELGPIFSQYGPRTWSIRYMYSLAKIETMYRVSNSYRNKDGSLGE